MSTPPSVPQASSAVGTIVAPAPTYSSLLMEDPTPASCWMNTSWPWLVSSCTPIGVIATRYSWFLTSLGTPTFTSSLLAEGPTPTGRLRGPHANVRPARQYPHTRGAPPPVGPPNPRRTRGAPPPVGPPNPRRTGGLCPP